MKLCRIQPCGKDEIRESCFSGPEFGTRADHSSRIALTLLEMMVAITLLAAIMIGLVAMFNQTQKALHIANAQTDVFENARGAIQLVTRDLAEMAAFDMPGVWNAFGLDAAEAGSVLPIPGPPPTTVPVQFGEAFWLTRANDEWRGIGYYVADDETTGKTNTGVGTLYRFSKTVRSDGVAAVRSGVVINNLFEEFRQPISTNTYRISDGVVHFSFLPTRPTTNTAGGKLDFVRSPSFAYLSNELPAYVDVEIGVLEPATLKQYLALRDLNAPTAKNFLRDHAEKIHFFRERVPIRNFINPYRANELQ